MHVASHHGYIGKAYTLTVTYKHECFEVVEVYNKLSDAEKLKYWFWDIGHWKFNQGYQLRSPAIEFGMPTLNGPIKVVGGAE